MLWNRSNVWVLNNSLPLRSIGTPFWDSESVFIPDLKEWKDLKEMEGIPLLSNKWVYWCYLFPSMGMKSPKYRYRNYTKTSNPWTYWDTRWLSHLQISPVYYSLQNRFSQKTTRLTETFKRDIGKGIKYLHMKLPEWVVYRLRSMTEGLRTSYPLFLTISSLPVHFILPYRISNGFIIWFRNGWRTCLTPKTRY